MGKKPDFESSQAKVMGLGLHAERPWPPLRQERVEYGDMPPLPNQALTVLLNARKARPHAESYRGFSVGASVMVRRNDGKAMAIGHGVNMKSGSGESEVDLHAEESILNALRPGDQVTSLGLVAPTQPEGGSGLLADTLHPCTYRCQPMMEVSPAVTSETLIICSTPDGRAVEWGTLDDFQRFHDSTETGPSGITTVKFSETPSVFAPVPKREVYHLVDGGELDIDTEDWDSTVLFPLLEWMRERGIRP